MTTPTKSEADRAFVLDVAELRRLLAAATPGPWTAHAPTATVNAAAYSGWLAIVHGGPDDAALIAAAVNALPGLLDRLSPENARVREALTKSAEWFESYAQNHWAKATVDGDAKGKMNETRAKFCRAALAASEPDNARVGVTGGELDKLIKAAKVYHEMCDANVAPRPGCIEQRREDGALYALTNAAYNFGREALAALDARK